MASKFKMSISKTAITSTDDPPKVDNVNDADTANSEDNDSVGVSASLPDKSCLSSEETSSNLQSTLESTPGSSSLFDRPIKSKDSSVKAPKDSSVKAPKGKGYSQYVGGPSFNRQHSLPNESPSQLFSQPVEPNDYHRPSLFSQSSKSSLDGPPPHVFRNTSHEHQDGPSPHVFRHTPHGRPDESISHLFCQKPDIPHDRPHHDFYGPPHGPPPHHGHPHGPHHGYPHGPRHGPPHGPRHGPLHGPRHGRLHGPHHGPPHCPPHGPRHCPPHDSDHFSPHLGPRHGHPHGPCHHSRHHGPRHDFHNPQYQNPH